MAVKLHTLLGSMAASHPASPGELERVSDWLMSSARRAGSDRARLMETVEGLEQVERVLRSVSAEQRHRAGRTHAVELAERALQLAASLRFAARPAGRYLPTDYLRDQLWRVVRSVELARVALQWAQPVSVR